MKHLKHPATIIAAIALFAALSGGAGAAMTTLISGSQIKNHSIPVNKLSASALKALRVYGMADTTGSGSATCPLNTTTADPATPTWCGKKATYTFDSKTAVQVTGNLDMASKDGNSMHGELAVCYAKHGSTNLIAVDHVFPSFTASAGSYFAQGVSGTIGDLKGKYDVGMCLFDETTNAGNGHYSVTMVATETTQGVMRLGPQTS